MELTVVQFFNHLGRGTVLDDFTFYISWIPFLILLWFLIALSFLIFDRKNGRKIALSLLLAVIIYFILNDIVIKPTMASIYFRLRPYIAYPDVIFSNELWADSSLPSGHMGIMAAMLTVVVSNYRRWWTWFLCVTFLLLIAFARIHNGMHYPSDLLAGTVLGIGYGLLSVWIVNKASLRLAK